MTTTLNTARAIADTLTGWGFGVHNPAWENAVNLKITNVRGALSELTISSDRLVVWEYHSFNGRHAGAAHLVSIVLDLLNPDWEEDTDVRLPVLPDRSLQGLIGRALREAGMRVAMGRPDTARQFLDAYADITVTNSAEPVRGTVCVADHGAIRWECQVAESTSSSDALDTSQIAITIIKALSRAHQPCCLV